MIQQQQQQGEEQAPESAVDLAYSVSMLSRDLAQAASRLGGLITSESSREDEVVSASKEAQSRYEILSSTVHRLFSASPTAASGVIPALIEKSRKRLSTLDSKAKAAFFNPFDLAVVQEVSRSQDKLVRSSKRLAAAADRLCADEADDPARSALKASATSVSQGTVGAFREVHAAINGRDKSAYVAAARSLLGAFGTAVGFSQQNGLGLEGRFRGLAMKIGVMSKACLQFPDDPVHAQEFFLLGREVSQLAMSLLVAVDARGSGGRPHQQHQEDGSEPGDDKPRSASMPRLSLRKLPSPPASPRRAPSPHHRGVHPSPASEEVIELLAMNFPAFKEAWGKESDAKRTLIISQIASIICPLPASPASTPPALPASPASTPPAPTPPAAADGPKLPTVTGPEKQARPSRPKSNPQCLAQLAKASQAEAEAAVVAAVAIQAKPANPLLPKRQPHLCTPSDPALSLSLSGPPSPAPPPSPSVICSIFDLSSAAEKRVLVVLGFARQVLAKQEPEAASHATVVADTRRSLAALLEGSVKHCSSVIPRCTSIASSGFALTDSSPRAAAGDDDFDGQSSKLMRAEFLGVSTLERALIAARRELLAEAPPLRPDDALIAAAAGHESQLVVSGLVSEIQKMASEILSLMGQVKTLVVSGLGSDAGPRDIQGIFGMAVLEIAAISALAEVVPQFTSAVETLRCIQHSAAAGPAAKDSEDAEAVLSARPDIGQATPLWKETTPAMLDCVFGGLRAGTINHIVSRLSADQSYDNVFLNTVLATYTSFCTPSELLRKLIERYHVPSGAVPTARVSAIRLKVGVVVKYLVDTQFADFDDEFLGELNCFLDVLKADGHKHLAESVVESISSQKAAAAAAPAASSAAALGGTAAVLSAASVEQVATLVGMLAEANEATIAQQLTVLDAEMFKRIKPSELLSCRWSRRKTRHRSPNVLAIISRSNALAGFVQTSVLSQLVLASRAKSVTKWILIADQLRKMRNFNSMMAVVAGLSTSPVSRLKQTWGVVKAPHLALFESIQELMDPTGSYKRYRETLGGQPTSFCLPYLGTTLTDLTFINDGNPDTLDVAPAGGTRKLINFKKRELFYGVVSALRAHVQEPCPFLRDAGLSPALEFLPHTSDDVLFDTSLSLEPRNVRRSELV